MKQRKIFTLMIVLAASLLFVGCSKSNETLTLNPDGSVRTAGTVPTTTNYTTTISITNGAFSPAEVTVMQSGSLLWVNKDSRVHTVTSGDESFDSGDIQPGGSFSMTFNTVGPFPYHCKYHSEATGIVKCVTK